MHPEYLRGFIDGSHLTGSLADEAHDCEMKEFIEGLEERIERIEDLLAL